MPVSRKLFFKTRRQTLAAAVALPVFIPVVVAIVGVTVVSAIMAIVTALVIAVMFGLQSPERQRRECRNEQYPFTHLVSPIKNPTRCIGESRVGFSQ
jgi:hypothetical protein